MNKYFLSITLGLALAFNLACATKATVVVPGEVNVFDGSVYTTLVTSKAVIDQTKADLLTGAFPVNIAANVKTAVNYAVQSYNAADTAYQTYHIAALAGTATVAQQANVTAAVNTLNVSVAGITTAKAGN